MENMKTCSLHDVFVILLYKFTIRGDFATIIWNPIRYNDFSIIEVIRDFINQSNLYTAIIYLCSVDLFYPDQNIVSKTNFEYGG